MKFHNQITISFTRIIFSTFVFFLMLFSLIKPVVAQISSVPVIRSMDNSAEYNATQRADLIDAGLELAKGTINLAEKALLKTILLSKNISDEELGRGVAVVIGTKVYLYNQLPPNVRTSIESNTGRIQLEIMTAYNQLTPDEKDTVSRVVSVGNIAITLLPYLAVTKTMTVVK